MKTKNIYVYVLLSTLLMICLGIVYSYSLFRLEIESYYNISKTQSGLPFMIVLLFYAISMAFSGILFEKYKTHLMTLIGIMNISVGFILSSFSQHILILTISYGVFIGIGIGILYTLPLRVIAQFSHKRLGFLTGITLLGFGLSPLIFAPIVESLLSQIGLSQTFLVFGLVYPFILCILGFPIARKDIKPKASSKISFDVLKQKSFYFIYLLFFIGTLIGLTAIGLSSSIGVESFNISKVNMALLLGLFSVFNGLGRPIYGYINDQLSFSRSAMISFISLVFASLFLWLFYQQTLIFIIAFIIIYFNFGGWLSLAPSATLHTFGKSNYSKTYGLIFTAYGLGAFVGNGLSSILIDLFSYRTIYLLLCIHALLGIFILIKRKKVEG